MAKKRGKSPAGKKSPTSGQGKGGSKKSKFNGGPTVKTPMQKKTKTTTTGSLGGASGAPKEWSKGISSTRTPYGKQTPGAVK